MNSALVNEYFPETVSLPGETLREVLEDRSMTQAKLAERMGRPKKTINEIIKGKTMITAETALQLERALGISATFWNNLERDYQECEARLQERESLSAQTPWLDELPVKEMIRRRWVRKHDDSVNQVRELLDFFGVASPHQWRLVFEQPQASFRRPAAFASDRGALAAWLRKGELDAQRLQCQPFNKGKFRAVLHEIRALTRERPEVFQPRLEEMCSATGVAVVFVPELPKSRVSGATRWLSSSKALIQLSLRYKTDDHLWFSFFHEAGHILLHGKKKTFLDQGNSVDQEQEEEEANAFAADFLIPEESLKVLLPAVVAQRVRKTQVRAVAKDLGIAPGIVVGRLQHMEWLPHSHLNDLKRRFDWVRSG